MVCPICLEHMRNWYYCFAPCHYCSQRCFRLDWKKHRLEHVLLSWNSNILNFLIYARKIFLCAGIFFYCVPEKKTNFKNPYKTAKMRISFDQTKDFREASKLIRQHMKNWMENVWFFNSRNVDFTYKLNIFTHNRFFF